jgi:hypothetical protein
MTSMRRCQSFVVGIALTRRWRSTRGSKRIDVNLYEVDALLCGVV